MVTPTMYPFWTITDRQPIAARVPPRQKRAWGEDTEMNPDEFAPVTPGEMLKEEFLADYGLSQNQLARAAGISPNRIAEIVNNRRRITADTALRLIPPCDSACTLATAPSSG
jgi:addiction module HigA family antidote